MRLLSTLLCFTFLSTSTAAYAVTLNEVRLDQPAGDSNEYVELKGTPGESLNGLTLVFIGEALPGADGGIENNGAISLSNQTIPADGIFLITENDAWTTESDMQVQLGLENRDNVTILLVSGFSGSTGDDLDTDNDCVLDVTPWSAVVDGVAIVQEENPPVITECHYATTAGARVGPDGSDAPGHAYRCDSTWEIGDFFYPTDDSPGFENDACDPVGIRDGSPLRLAAIHTVTPNPFNPATRIQFTLAQPMRVRLSIFTQAGRLVTTLIDEHVDAGISGATWNGMDDRGRPMASGVYVARLTGPGVSLSRKLALVK